MKFGSVPFPFISVMEISLRNLEHHSLPHHPPSLSLSLSLSIPLSVCLCDPCTLSFCTLSRGPPLSLSIPSLNFSPSPLYLSVSPVLDTLILSLLLAFFQFMSISLLYLLFSYCPLLSHIPTHTPTHTYTSHPPIHTSAPQMYIRSTCQLCLKMLEEYIIV